MASIRNKRKDARTSARPRKTTVPRRKAAELDLRRTPMQARGQATFEGILDATATLLEEVGGERLTTNLIAKAAGVNVATLYQYFPNKQTVLLELFRRQSQRSIELSEARLAGLNDAADWRRVISGVIQALTDARASTPGTAALRQLMRSSPDLLEHEQSYSKRMAGALAEELRAAGAKREQALLVARCTTEALTALLDWWLIDTGGRDARIVGEAKAVVISYLAPHLTKKTRRRP
jgi:AcrR family transcriptional regulator